MRTERRHTVDLPRPSTVQRLALPLGLVAGLLVLATAGFFWSRRIRPPVPVPTWAEIQRDARAQRWDEAELKLERWVAVNSRHGEGLVVLADLYLRRGRDN